MSLLASSVGRLALVLALATPSPPPIPLKSGNYHFEHRFAEQPTLRGIRLVARIADDRITLRNPGPAGVFPRGIIAEGTIAWHAASGQWIIARSKLDRNVAEVGGCSDGPEVIDLHRRIYWTC